MAKKNHNAGRFMRNQNTWKVKDDILYCYLGRELLFFTDHSNLEKLSGLSFSKLADGYAGIKVEGKSILVHRYLTDAPKDKLVDHINRNKKDNRLINLRLTDKSVNAFNSNMRSNNTSGYTGVRFRKDTKKWTAEIKKDYKKYNLGCFANIEEAICARKEAEKILYGESEPMKINSRNKGKKGELELAHILKQYGYDAKRGRQFNGLDGSADVVGLPGVHIECKRVEQLNIDSAMEQAVRDARDDEIPCVFHRKNRKPWKVTMLLEDWMKLYKNQIPF